MNRIEFAESQMEGLPPERDCNPNCPSPGIDCEFCDEEQSGEDIPGVDWWRFAITLAVIVAGIMGAAVLLGYTVRGATCG